MSHSPRSSRRPHASDQDPTVTRACIGVLGLFPMITAVLTPVVGNIPIAMVLAAVGAVTILALLPLRAGRQR